MQELLGTVFTIAYPDGLGEYSQRENVTWRVKEEEDKQSWKSGPKH